MADLARNVKTLMSAAGLSLPLSERSLGIQSLRFFGGTLKQPFDVEADELNMASRLFVEILARDRYLIGQTTSLLDVEQCRVAAEQFFAEYWDTPASASDIRAIVEGFRSGTQVKIFWKVSAYPREALTFEALVRRLRVH
jgi:hypothetical protein